ncbi:Rac prophage; zinc-binding protein [Escherichia coli]|uniref:Rac prophage zinc-binding protein n=1 Tax=Escherichia coli TaxID=562 RepID=A0A377E4D6_ECOLX|nr:Rac prophage; zinc-binding protein [Escherichia coli]
MTKKIKCAYHLCKKDVEESKAIERMLHFMHGILSKDERENIAVKLVPKKTRWHMNFN